MCALCGTFTEASWSAVPAPSGRPKLDRARLAAAAATLAAGTGVRVAVWGQGFRVTGPTGRIELAADLAGVWRAVDALGRAAPDPLSADGG